ncbi:MAG: tetratricopeptide repeat protein [Pirellulales bacterium]
MLANLQQRTAATMLVGWALCAAAGCSTFTGGPKNWSQTLNAIARRPDPFAVEMGNAIKAEDAGKAIEAKVIYERLVRDFPKRYEPHHRLAIVLDRQKRHREAQAHYAEAQRLAPDKIEILNDLGYSFYLQGQLNKAESALAKAVKAEPGNSRFRNNLGLVLGQQGRMQEAQEQFRQAGSEADAQYNLAFIHASKNDMEAAKKCFRAALLVDPSYEKARKTLDSFERFERDPEGAMAMAEIVKDGVKYVPYIESSTPAPAASTGRIDSTGQMGHAFHQAPAASAPAANVAANVPSGA